MAGTEKLPAGWEQRQNSHGRAYYVDHNTQTVTWTNPCQQQYICMRDQNLNGQRTSSQYPAHSISATATNETTACEGRLPAGWEQQHTPEGRCYFIDHNTQTRTWTDPRQQQWNLKSNCTTVKTQPVPRLGIPRTGLVDLVPVTPIARPLAVHHETKTTTWRHPRGPSFLDQEGFVDARRPKKLVLQEAVAERLPVVDTSRKEEGRAEAKVQKPGASVESSPIGVSNTGVFKKSMFDGQASRDLNCEISNDEDYVDVEDNAEEDDWEII